MAYLVEALIIFSFLWISLWFYFNQAFNYWKKKNIAYIQPKIPFGCFGNPLWDKKGVTMRLRDAYDELKTRGVKYGGFYVVSQPVLLIISPELVKTVLNTAFEHFEGNGNTFDEKSEPLGAHLLNLHGQRWKDMRVKLTPTFTSGKMKIMFQMVLKCGEQLEDHIKACCEEKRWIDIKDTVACFTTDVIGSCAFGLECNSLKNPALEFRLYGKRAFYGNLNSVLRRYGNIVCPGIIKALKLPLFDRSSTDFFTTTIKKIVDYRKTNKVVRNDFVQLLLNIEEAGFTAEEIAAQAFVFFLAGFETSSTTMTFCLSELAHHQEIQEKVRDEIISVIERYNGNLTYEGIMEMRYLEQVVNETLRKYPPLPVMKRLCNKDYQLSDGFVIQKDTIVFLSTLGMHRDEEYFPNPDKFDPERFSDVNKGKIPSYAYIPFGGGPRTCLGLRFGLLQVKVGLCTILKNHKVLPHDSQQYPFEYEPRNPMLNAKGSVLMNFDAVNYNK